MQTYTIKEISELFQSPASALRYYEAIKKAIAEKRELSSWKDYMD